MIKHIQTTFGDGSDGKEKGNCFATCIACLLELPVKDVPNFVESDEWYSDVQDFLKGYGYSLVIVDTNHENNYWFHDGYAIAAGMGNRGLRHCVVVKHGEQIHDPHPDQDYLVNIDRLYFLASLNPRI